MDLPDGIPVLADYKIEFNGEQVEVAVIEIHGRPPEVYFLVHYQNKRFFLSRFPSRPDLWNGGSSLDFDEAKMLGEAIEKQTGYTLPLRPSNNPFEYKGDIKVTIESYLIGDIIIKRAKAPFTESIFYQIILSEKTIITIAYSKYDHKDTGCWLPETNLNEEDFDFFKDLLVHFEQAYQLGLYKPLQEE